MQTDNYINDNLRKTIKTFINVVPIIVGMLLLTSLVITVFPEQISTGLFGNGDILDTLLGASIGSIAVGHTLAAYFRPHADPIYKVSIIPHGRALGVTHQLP